MIKPALRGIATMVSAHQMELGKRVTTVTTMIIVPIDIASARMAIMATTVKDTRITAYLIKAMEPVAYGRVLPMDRHVQRMTIAYHDTALMVPVHRVMIPDGRETIVTIRIIASARNATACMEKQILGDSAQVGKTINLKTEAVVQHRELVL